MVRVVTFSLACRALAQLKQAAWPPATASASAFRFCRLVVAAARSRDLSDSFVGRFRPIEAVGNAGERTGEFSFTPDLDRHVWIRKSFAEDHRAGGKEGCWRYNEPYTSSDSFTNQRAMTQRTKEKAKAVAVASVGAGVGGAGGASVGVLELAAMGTATEVTAGAMIVAGAAAGAALFLAGWGLYQVLTKPHKKS